MTKIFCAANKHFMQLAVVRVNRDWRYKIVFRLNDMSQWPKLLRTSIFNKIMYVGIAEAKTERLNTIAKLVLL